MGRKKKGYGRKRYESMKPGTGFHDSYVAMYASMTNSPAFIALTGNQRELYRFCRSQLYTKNKPRDDFPDCEAFQPQEVFYMNWGIAKATEPYKDQKTFRKDLKRLIEVGFIECLYDAKKSGKKSVYIFSDKWWNFTGSENK